MNREKKERNRKMLYLYTDDRLILDEIGGLYGISRERVRQVISKFPEYKAMRSRPRLNRDNYKLMLSLRDFRENDKATEKFWQQVDKSGDCWEWIGCRNQESGYGRFNNKFVMDTYSVGKESHRISWCMYHNKPIPDGMWVLHTCDNPSCVNPSHLYLGTPADNVKDRQERSGWTDFTRKLSDRDVSYIRNVFDRAGVGCIESIAEKYGISTSYVYRLGKNLTKR